MNPAAKSYGAAILRTVVLAVFSAMLLLAVGIEAQSMPTRHVRKEVTGGAAPLLKRLPATQSLSLDIALPLRNESELDTLLQDLYDPQSTSFHQFLSVQEFTERFGPSEEDYAAVVSFAKQHGLTVTGTSPNRMVLNVAGPVANIEKAFQVTMASYQHPTEGRSFYSPDREPSPELQVQLWHISGLDNFSIPTPASLSKAPQATNHATGSGPDGFYTGSDMREAYYGGSTLTGAGQSVGLFEFMGYNLADVDAYFASVGQTRKVAVNGISTDGASLSCTGSCDDTEQVLDIEAAISMAPGMSQVRVYVSNVSDVNIFNKMATDNISKSLSCSWAWSPADPASDDPIFKEFAAQGQSLFVASGDNGAYTGSGNVYPADDAYVTSVGGTNLATSSAGGSWMSESAWTYSSGGISPNRIAIPSYQKTRGVITSANKGSKTFRNVPDVAAEADTDNYICSDGICEGGWGGTSFAAPRWAGFLALVNQQSVANGKSTLGFLNPKIYAIGLESSYTTGFHDITGGSNGTYSTEKGYDLVTGWGTPNRTGLINALAP
jgi:kumamolisin